jgi:hypothetical protein
LALEEFRNHSFAGSDDTVVVRSTVELPREHEPIHVGGAKSEPPQAL